jgi:hypothetical protein
MIRQGGRGNPKKPPGPNTEASKVKFLWRYRQRSI